MKVMTLCLGAVLALTPIHAGFAAQLNEEVEVIPLQSMGLVEVVAGQKERTMTVNHEVREGDVYIECFIHSFTFSKEKVGHAHQDGEGHVRLYINGQHVDTIFQAAFIIKGLPSGTHEIKVEVVKNDKSAYGLEECFSVTIP